MSQPSYGYVDLQVNGYAGVDFNSDHLSAESLFTVCEKLSADGVAGVLATIITDDVDRMAARLSRLARLRSSDPLVQQVIWGVHVEGPFISDLPGFVGAHPVRATRNACRDIMQRLLDASEGLIRIVTLAPERDPQMAVTKWLADQGICVAAGHCNPSVELLDAAIDAGVTLFTHLGNGCPLDLPRHDNIIQRVLSRSERICISFIADGVHIPLHALGNYVKNASIQQSIVITDSISAAGLGSGTYMLGDQEVTVDSQGATWSSSHSHLVGSAATMPQVALNLKEALGMSEYDVKMLTCDNPKRLLFNEVSEASS